MKFYLPTHSVNYVNFFGIVDINEETRQRFLSLRGAFAQLHEQEQRLYQLMCWDSLLWWYESNELTADESFFVGLEVTLSGGEIAHLPDKFELSKTPRMVTEYSLLRVTAEGVSWECLPKHGSERVETDEIPWALLLVESKSQHKRVETQLHGRRRGRK
jgi:hypothetical protein